MSLKSQLDTVMRRMRRVSPRLKRYGESSLASKIIARTEAAVEQKGMMARVLGKRFNFMGPHGPHGSKWQPLTKNYLRWKLRHGFPRWTNVRTYDLFNAASDAVGGTWKFGRKTRWGNALVGKVAGEVDYAGHVEKARSWGKDPIKKELEETETFAMKIVLQELKKIARGGG